MRHGAGGHAWRSRSQAGPSPPEGCGRSGRGRRGWLARPGSCPGCAATGRVGRGRDGIAPPGDRIDPPALRGPPTGDIEGCHAVPQDHRPPPLRRACTPACRRRRRGPRERAGPGDRDDPSEPGRLPGRTVVHATARLRAAARGRARTEPRRRKARRASRDRGRPPPGAPGRDPQLVAGLAACPRRSRLPVLRARLDGARIDGRAGLTGRSGGRAGLSARIAGGAPCASAAPRSAFSPGRPCGQSKPRALTCAFRPAFRHEPARRRALAGARGRPRWVRRPRRHVDLGQHRHDPRRCEPVRTLLHDHPVGSGGIAPTPYAVAASQQAVWREP